MNLAPKEHVYGYGYRDHDRALDALEHMFASGEVSGASRPRLARYTAANGRRLWAIVLSE